MIVPYVAPIMAIVPLFPATTRRESVCRRKRVPIWFMPDNYDGQERVHKALLGSGWKPIAWEVI